MVAIVSGCVRLFDKDLRLSGVKKILTVKVWVPGEDDPVLVDAYLRGKGYIDVPRQYGIDMALRQGIDLDWNLSYGYELPKTLKPVNLYDYQKPFVRDLYDAVVQEHDTIGFAATGKGKTVMSLEVARRLGSTTLIIVDQEFLRDQWIKELKSMLQVPEDEIGIIQGPKCEVEGKSFCVAMIQTLYSKKLPSYVYEYFGTVIVDEAHTAGAPQFSKALLQFSAAHRFGVTATPQRGDSMQKVLHWNLGNIGAKLENKHIPSQTRYIQYEEATSWYANISPKNGRFVSELVADGKRNLILAEAIKWLYDSGRDVLTVTERVEHAENMEALCSYLGIPGEDMGVVAGTYNIWKYAKEPNPPSRPPGWQKGTEYTPVSLQLVNKKTPRDLLKERKDRCRVIHATYGMFTKGVDVPRLSAGVDLTPRSKAVQVHGRILRPQEGKLTPIWVTMRDINSKKAEYQFLQRLSEYEQSNAEVVLWRPGEGIKKKEIAKLKREVRASHVELSSAEVIAEPDGRNTVMIPNSGKKSSLD